MSFQNRMALPLVVAPMTGVSGPELVLAACQAGAIGSFPTHNAESLDELDFWCSHLNSQISRSVHSPWVPNVVVHRSNHIIGEVLDVLVSHRPEAVITSVGDPSGVVDRLHAGGSLVWSDVASIRHAKRALEVGADGLILLTAGAGGNAGWANPFAFVRAVREFYSGTVVLAGGISDAVAMRAAKTLGCDLVYMGTRFIATIESRAGDSYRDAIVRGTMDDVALSSKLTGLPANILTTSPGYAELSSSHLYRDGAFVFDSTIFSAGHSIGGVRAVKSVRSVVDDLVAEYNEQ